VRLRGTFEALLDVLPSMTNVGLVLLGAARVDSGHLTVGQLSSFVYLFTLLVFPLRLIGYALSELPHSLAGWRRVRAVLDEPIEPDPLDAIAVAEPGRGIHLGGVGYTFVGETRPALRDISLDVARGRIVAVVGPTGAGKTTLVEVVGGLLPPDVGTVAIGAGGRAVVFQEPFLFSGTIRSNIAYGRPDATDLDVERAARAVGAHDLVRGMADGYHTSVSETGRSLSAGQRQLLCLARAQLVDPTILILDEATSNLDLATEAEVQRAMNLAARGRTTLLIAHRLQTARTASRIVVVEEGRLVEDGTHEELVAAGGRYAELWDAFDSTLAAPVPIAGE
jgi:ATP-binding cassette, subfamily B, bacterial